MSRKIKFHAFHFLFRLFAYLADKSGGWRVFVSPKLVLGSLIVGLGLTGSQKIEAQSQSTIKKTKLRQTENKLNSTIKSSNNVKTDYDISCYLMCDVKIEIEKIGSIEDTIKGDIYDIVEQMPLFHGGEDSLRSFIAKNLKYPIIAQENGIQGRVIVRFIVTKTGKIDRIEILRSLDPGCDKEAIRVIKVLPDFTPGKQNGVNVNVWYTIPIIFKLPK